MVETAGNRCHAQPSRRHQALFFPERRRWPGVAARQSHRALHARHQLRAAQAYFQQFHTQPLLVNLPLAVLLASGDQLAGRRFTDDGGDSHQLVANSYCLSIDTRKPSRTGVVSNSELDGRTAPLGVLRPRVVRLREDRQPVALATTSVAGCMAAWVRVSPQPAQAPELSKAAARLLVADQPRRRDQRAVALRDAGKSPVHALGVEQWRLRHHRSAIWSGTLLLRADRCRRGARRIQSPVQPGSVASPQSLWSGVSDLKVGGAVVVNDSS